MSPPKQKPGVSRQDYETPDEFVRFCEEWFAEEIQWDLAATDYENSKARLPNSYFSVKDDSLTRNWHSIGGLLWLNPPYANIKLWAEKCAREAVLGAHILLLVPASVGSNWFWRYVYGRAHVYCVRPRITFVGETNPYPKDLILCEYLPHYLLRVPLLLRELLWRR